MKLKYMNWLCVVSLSRYQSNGQIAIQLTLDETDPSIAEGDGIPGEMIAMPTVNLGGWFYRDFEVSIKQYSELSGTLKYLVDGGLLKPPHGHLDLHGSLNGGPRSVLTADHASCHVALCYFTDEAKAAFPEFFIETEECEECGELIPVVTDGGLANKHHDESCSLHDATLA